jgi:hypothetical protein
MNLVEAPEQRDRVEQAMLRILAQIDSHHAQNHCEPRREGKVVE